MQMDWEIRAGKDEPTNQRQTAALIGRIEIRMCNERKYWPDELAE